MENIQAVIRRQIRERQRRMVEDDDFMDVSPKDVRDLLAKLRKEQNTKLIQKMRIKYDHLIDDAEKRKMKEMGLNYFTHHIEYGPNYSLIINGYTEKQWRLLNDEDFRPPDNSIFAIIQALEKQNDAAAVVFLKSKYADAFENRKRKRMARGNLPPAASSGDIDTNTIDGLSFSEWRALNDPDYKISRQYLVRLVNKYTEQGDMETVMQLVEKYN